jgi:uncharacterized protein (DUF1800 family)
MLRAAFVGSCILALGLALANSGGGSPGSTASTAPIASVVSASVLPSTPAPVGGMTTTDAARLLEQATFGPTPSEVTRVAALGLDGYLNQQLATPATGYPAFSFVPHTAATDCKSDPANPASTASLCARDNYTLFQVQRAFFENALTGADQLRQRVAFALSQIMVVSGVEIYEAYGMAAYQNMLLQDAFGNYRQLLEDVTLSPVMGHYLDMANNDKANPSLGTSPNENYAREVLQLFSIGVNQLNPDGTLVLGSDNQPVPTYSQDVILGFSSLFTGWTYPPRPGASTKWTNPINYQGTMVSFPNHHETGTKLLLDGVVAPAGQTPEQDLKLALDTVFNHPNVGPFIGKELIQHLVTSNPSPGYVSRVAAVFANNGQGVRGDLAAVVRAILSDVEARGDAPSSADEGHLREPALFITSVLRGLGGKSDGVFLRSQAGAMGQPIFTAPTVFNFYPPSYQLPGTSALAPEFFIDDAATILARANFLNTLIYRGGALPDPTVTGSIGTTLDLTPLTTAGTPDAIVDQLSTELMHGSLSSAAHAAVTSALGALASDDAVGRARAAAYLVASSAQFQVEH